MNFRSSLFVIVPNWKQPKYSSTSEQIYSLYYNPNGGILPSNQKGQIIDTHDNMDESNVLC